MKKTIASIFLAVTMTAQAQTASTTNVPASTSAPSATTASETAAPSFAKSPWNLQLDTETITGRRKDHEPISQFNTNIYPTAEYEIIDNSIISLYPSFHLYRNRDDKETKKEKDHYTFKNDYVALKFTQKNILTEDQNGVDLKADIRYYDYVTSYAKNNNELEAKVNVRTYLDKKFSDKWSFNNHNRFYVNDTSKTFTKDTTPRDSYDLRATPTYHVTDKFTTGFQVQYLGNNMPSVDKEKHAKVNLIPNVGYVFSDSVSLLSEMKYTPFVSGDNKTFKGSDFVSNNELSVAFNEHISAVFIANFPLLTKNGNFNNKLGKEVEFEVDLTMVAF